MHSTLHPETTTEASVETPVRRPATLRRVFLAAASAVALALPVVWTVNMTCWLLIGEHADHASTS